MTIKVSDKCTKEINGIKRYFIVINDKECKITKKIYESITVGAEYKEHDKMRGMYKINPNSKWLVPLGNYLK